MQGTEPTPAPPSNRTWPAFAACTWAGAFAAVHLYWGLGGSSGLPPGRSVSDNTALFVINLVAIPLCLIGALLALALVQPWGRRLPRRWLLVASWSTCALFIVHSLPAIAQGALLVLGPHDDALSAEERFSLFLYEPYWFAGGVLFGLAALNFQRAR